MVCQSECTGRIVVFHASVLEGARWCAGGPPEGTTREPRVPYHHTHTRIAVELSANRKARRSTPHALSENTDTSTRTSSPRLLVGSNVSWHKLRGKVGAGARLLIFSQGWCSHFRRLRKETDHLRESSRNDPMQKISGSHYARAPQQVASTVTTCMVRRALAGRGRRIHRGTYALSARRNSA